MRRRLIGKGIMSKFSLLLLLLSRAESAMTLPFLHISISKGATRLHKEIRVGCSEPARKSWLQTT